MERDFSAKDNYPSDEELPAMKRDGKRWEKAPNFSSFFETTVQCTGSPSTVQPIVGIAWYHMYHQPITPHRCNEQVLLAISVS